MIGQSRGCEVRGTEYKQGKVGRVTINRHSISHLSPAKIEQNRKEGGVGLVRGVNAML